MTRPSKQTPHQKQPSFFSNLTYNTLFPTKELTLRLIFFFLLSGFTAQAQWRNPTDEWKTLGPPKGTLMVIGGSAVPSLYKDFVELAGGPNALIVMIPTAGDVVDENNGAYPKLVEAGAKNIVILHTKDREQANTKEFVAPLLKAKGVFISGGFQNRLARAYLHTLTHQAMFDVLARGGVVAGSSAGASIQGSFLYGGGDEKEGFGFIKNSAIGQHYVRRNRMGSVARILKNDPNLLGIGIDEATAIVVKGNEFEVTGDSKVAVYDASLPGWPVPEAQYYLFLGDKFNMASRKITHEAKPLPKDLWANASKPWLNPNSSWQTTGPPEGKLLIYGSEETTDEMLKHFVKSETTSKSSIVVISTGNAEKQAKNQEIANKIKTMGFKNISFLHSINHQQANSNSFVAPLKSATAVWICDSEKWQLADSYLNSLLHKELFEVLKRNGTIAGTGSGAAIMASRLFGEPESYRWTKGYGLARNTMIFNEPLASKALKSMQDILQKNTNLLGIGVAKGTILEIRKNNLEVSGSGSIQLYKATDEKPTIIPSGQQYTLK